MIAKRYIRKEPSGKIKSSLILGGFLLFVFFVIVRFPYRNLQGRLFDTVQKRTGIYILSDDMYLSLFGWPGVGLTRPNVTIPMGGKELALSSEKLICRVGIASLFPFAPAVSLSLKTLQGGGNLFLRVAQLSNSNRASWEADALSIQHLTQSLNSKVITGTLDSDGSVSIESDFSKSTGNISLKGSQLNLLPQYIKMSPEYGFMVPSLKVGPLNIDIKIQGGTAELSSFKFGEAQSDLTGGLSGTIKLGRDYSTSEIDITLRIKLSNQILQNKDAETFLSFLSGYQTPTKGEYAMRWKAQIQDFSTNFLAALPQKVN